MIVTPTRIRHLSLFRMSAGLTSFMPDCLRQQLPGDGLNATTGTLVICTRRPIAAASVGAVSLAVVAVMMVAGCSSGSTATTAGSAGVAEGSVATNAAGGSGGSVASSGSSAVAASGGSGGDLSRYCSAIKQADAQALVKSDVGKVSAVIGECSFAGGDLKMDLYADPDKKYYGDNAGPSAHSLSGVGDEAIWYQPVSGMTAPEVNARKGTLTCTVSTPSDVSTTTLPYTGSPPFTKVTDTDAAAYAQKVGVLCADVFAASG